MSSAYRKSQWREFRQQIIEIDGARCTRCQRGPADGACLQVHHRLYIAGRLPWEYPPGACETLCKGCHAETHGLIRPSEGWECVGEEDLEEICDHCEDCGTAIRYVYFIVHPAWDALAVGTDCCDRLTGNTTASVHTGQLTLYADRVARFLASPRWDRRREILCIEHGGISAEIRPTAEGTFGLRLNGVPGRKSFATTEDAMRFLHRYIDDGSADRFFRARAPKLQGGQPFPAVQRAG